MNAHVKISPVAVTDPHIRKMLQLAGLRFMCTVPDGLRVKQR